MKPQATPFDGEPLSPGAGPSYLELFRTAAVDWIGHRSPRLGAALAYYAVFSLGPLLLIVTAVAGLFFDGEQIRSALSNQFRGLVGDDGGKAIEAMIDGASSPASGKLMAAVGIVLLLIAALGVVVQLKDAMNTIWEVEATPGQGLWSYVRTYLVSFAGILALEIGRAHV